MTYYDVLSSPRVRMNTGPVSVGRHKCELVLARRLAAEEASRRNRSNVHSNTKQESTEEHVVLCIKFIISSLRD
jgi:hypothetical protein